MPRNQRRMTLETECGKSIYTIGTDVLETLPEILATRPSLLIADDRAVRCGTPCAAATVRAESVLRLRGGEGIKTLGGLRTVYDRLAAKGFPRDGRLVGIGGGTILDLCGLAASTWARGVEFIAVPTTLLAAVDAAIGGKTAVNLGDLKNPVGTFHPAARILVQPDVLETLPRREWRNGMAELVKTAVIGAPGLFRELEAASERLRGLLGRGRSAATVPGIGDLPWEDWIAAAARVKIRIVASDFRETGPRRVLNLGHTLGHALELTQGLGHGEAVSLGLAAVCRLAAADGVCGRDTAGRIVRLLSACGLPIAIRPVDRNRLLALISRDKKRAGPGVGWVLPSRIGRVLTDRPVEPEAALAALDERS